MNISGQFLHCRVVEHVRASKLDIQFAIEPIDDFNGQHAVDPQIIEGTIHVQRLGRGIGTIHAQHLPDGFGYPLANPLQGSLVTLIIPFGGIGVLFGDGRSTLLRRLRPAPKNQSVEYGAGLSPRIDNEHPVFIFTGFIQARESLGRNRLENPHRFRLEGKGGSGVRPKAGCQLQRAIGQMGTYQILLSVFFKFRRGPQPPHNPVARHPDLIHRPKIFAVGIAESLHFFIEFLPGKPALGAFRKFCHPFGILLSRFGTLPYPQFALGVNYRFRRVSGRHGKFVSPAARPDVNVQSIAGLFQSEGPQPFQVCRVQGFFLGDYFSGGKGDFNIGDGGKHHFTRQPMIPDYRRGIAETKCKTRTLSDLAYRLEGIEQGVGRF